MKKWNNYSDVKVDSKWEGKLLEGVMKGVTYHPELVRYTKPSTSHTYQPDFEVQVPSEHGFKTSFNTILVEAKGRFREVAEFQKYLHIRNTLDTMGIELVFLFMKPLTPMPNAKRRKDGTKRTHAEWAESQHFRWFTEETIKEILK